MKSPSEILIRFKYQCLIESLWSFCYKRIRDRIWIERCDAIAEIEKIRGLKKGDKKKRKDRREEIDEKGGEKKKLKIGKQKNNKQKEKKIEKIISLVTLDKMTKDITVTGKAITKNWID
ncbi:hypothetical protein RhiirA1_461055 [Rhizophagus irregularis]|uniref:Uncharacterized protein n=1 Tax=Rhizophagus irregularis TaxID=588596 RepID=A0A2N0RQ55_9GLOM|nr:hypothetical protein RhiirA1_461055 [Rhizophagus irregularis]